MARESAAAKKKRLAAEAATPEELTETALAEAEEPEKAAKEAKPEAEEAPPALVDKSMVTVATGKGRVRMTMAAYKAMQESSDGDA